MVVHEAGLHPGIIVTTLGVLTPRSQQDINTLSCPIKSNSKQIELTVQPSFYWGLRLTLCYQLWWVVCSTSDF